MAKHTVKNLDSGQLDLMWNFLRFTKDLNETQNIVPQLKEHCDCLRQAMVQKVSGEYAESKGVKGYVKLEDLGTIINCIVIETMQLRLCGGLDFLLEAVENSNGEKTSKGGD